MEAEILFFLHVEWVEAENILLDSREAITALFFSH